MMQKLKEEITVAANRELNRANEQFPLFTSKHEGVGQQNEPPDDTGANDREKRAMQAAARAYMQIMKGG